VGASAELLQTLGSRFGGFDFDVDGLRAVLDGQIEQRKLLFDAAVESPMVLVAAARGEDDAVGKAFQEAADGGGALRRLIEKVEAEFEEGFTGFGFAMRVFQQRGNIGQA
jgi:ABC-type transporter Mla subunit MlaD